MHIREIAKYSGLSSKTIRYYEEIGLLPAPERLANGYRDYSETAGAMLRFIRRARELGFSIDECRRLLSLYQDKNRASRDVHELAQNKIAAIDRKIKEFQTMRRQLEELTSACSGDESSDCAILNGLSGEQGGENESSSPKS